MSVTQLAVLFVLAVLMSALSMTPEMLNATAQFANEGNSMMKETNVILFKAVTTSISAIWCSCIAAGAVPCSI